MLNPYLRMPANSWVRWISLMWISLRVFHLPYRLIRSQQIEIHVRRWELLPRCTTIYVCSLHVPEPRTVLSATRLLPANHHNRSLIKSLNYQQQLSFKSWHRWFGHAKESLLNSSAISLPRDTLVPASMERLFNFLMHRS